MRSSVAAIVVSLGLLAACQPKAPEVDPIAEADTIRRLEQSLVAAIASDDATAAASIYAHDSVLYSAGFAPANTTASREAMFAGMVNDPNAALTFNSDRVVVSPDGTMAFSSGAYTMTMTNPETNQPATETGSFVTVWQKQVDGSWKIVSDINTPGPTSR